MNEKKMAELLKMLGNENRLLILEALMQNQMVVGDIAKKNTKHYAICTITAFGSIKSSWRIR